MIKKWPILAVIILLFCFCITACSKNEDAGQKKGTIKEFTDKTAQKATAKIKTPIDKARNTQTQGEDRLKAMDEALQKQ